MQAIAEIEIPFSKEQLEYFSKMMNHVQLSSVPSGSLAPTTKVISMSQNAFVEGRQIMDAVLDANEAIDSIVKSNRGAILCKLDIKKAYDHVDWAFLLAVLEKMGFGERWCRGLRQGDPLSPYLFVVVMEAFSCLLKRAVAGGCSSPCLIRGRRGEGVQVSHLLFVDDTLIFCEAKEDQLLYLCWLLMWFEAISRLRANLEKSELIPVDRVENVDELADEFGYKVGKLPSTYLGMLLGAPFKCVAAWDGIEERFRKKLAMWKRQVVRIGLEKIQRDFLWGGGALEQKPYLVRALLGKWVWRFANERKALWNQVIRGKYGEERGGWRSSSNKEAWVNEVWTAEGERGGSWNPCFNRPFNDWELEEVERLFCCLEGKKVRVDEEDRVKWMETKDGVFSPKLSFFAWEASWGRVLTLDCLQKRVKETLLGWRGSFVGKKRKVAWQLGPLCLFWAIWKARNSIAFEDCGLSIQKLKASFMYLL
ncbi:hypothetical protein CK203_048761 [Vitis vinifera]|uniref:Reverse transcriptase domain-containing protein n=1 Tax=Vitis vinifera TaxID=29760 RepID=A0A438GDR5_VITVI|nr:hypothetical protein CK203_048761 [Vitis vinifera]